MPTGSTERCSPSGCLRYTANHATTPTAMRPKLNHHASWMAATREPYQMASAAPADMPAVYTPMANEFAVPGNHRRRSFAEFALSAATPMPMKKLEAKSVQ